MRKTKISFFVVFLITLAGLLGSSYIFRISSTAQIDVVKHGITNEPLKCYRDSAAQAIDDNGVLNVVVWNIFKQNNANWQTELEQYSQYTRLALLQEVSMSEQFKDYVFESEWFSSHVNAFKSFDINTGVLNLSIRSPLVACAYLQVEPWLLLPKSGIYAVYRLSDERKLAVVNLHSINFTYGIHEYEQQLTTLSDALKNHEGPIIFAGDFNTWSVDRFAAIEQTLKKMGLIEVAFAPDNRKQFFNGMALDHVFYRELNLVSAQSPVTSASDHNPLLVSFRL